MRMKKGFTLIELSIVLIIIGLVIGGVMVGKTLIKSAEVSRAIGDLDKINAAVNSFKIKYNCLPGDCTNSTSLFDSTVAGNGNGNGLIEWASESTYATYSLLAAQLIAKKILQPGFHILAPIMTGLAFYITRIYIVILGAGALRFHGLGVGDLQIASPATR